MSDIERVKEAVNIVSYIQQYAPLKKAGKYHKACCPFHAEKTPSFVVNEALGTWRCYGACSMGGDVLSFAMKKHNWTFGEALAELARLYNVTLAKSGPAYGNRETDERILGLLKIASDLYHQELLRQPHVMAYLMNERGLMIETIEKFRLGYAPQSWAWMKDQLLELGYAEKDLQAAGITAVDDKGHSYDRFRNRLLFPISDIKGVRGFGGRAMGDDKAKYINSPDAPHFHKSSLLYGFTAAKPYIIDKGEVVVVEGYMDVLQAHQAGFRNVVAQMGTALTEGQLNLLGRVTKKIILALDADSAGQAAMRKNANDLYAAGHISRLEIDLRIAQWDGDYDPDDLIRLAPHLFAVAVDTANSAIETILDTLTLESGLTASITQKQAILRDLSPLLNGLDPLTKSDTLRVVSERLGVKENDVRAWQGISVLPKNTAPTPSAIQPQYPPMELLVLHGLIVNESDGWLARANAVIHCAAPHCPRAASPLSQLDFSATETRALMGLIESGVSSIEDMPPGLHEIYQRAVFNPLAEAVFGGGKMVASELAYEAFVKAAIGLRKARLERDMNSQLMDAADTLEWATVRVLLGKLAR